MPVRGWCGVRCWLPRASQLHATGNNPAAARDDLAAYDEMAFRFAIDERGLVIRGLCSRIAGSASSSGPSVRCWVSHGRSVTDRSAIAVGRGAAVGDIWDDAVPADPAAQSLLSVLPLPAAEPSGLDAEPQAVQEDQEPPPVSGPSVFWTAVATFLPWPIAQRGGRGLEYCRMPRLSRPFSLCSPQADCHP